MDSSRISAAVGSIDPGHPVGWAPGHIKPSWWSLRSTKQKVGMITAAALLALCAFGSALSGGAPDPTSGTPVQVPNSATAPSQNAPTAQAIVKGSGNAVVQTGLKLNGAYKVDYSFGSWCGTAEFLNASGQSGAEFMEDVNDCSGKTDAKLVGSTVVHLTNVTTVKTGNTRGGWSLTFTPLG